MRKPFLPAFLLTALLLTLPVRAGETASAAPAPLFPHDREAPAFTDVADTWCERYVATVCRTGLMTGRSATVFDAVTPLTNAQIAVIVARLHSLLQGGDGTLPAAAPGAAWFQSAVDVLLDAYPEGHISLFLTQFYDAYDPIYPEDPCTRERFVKLLAAVVPEAALTPLNEISLVPDTEDPEILAFYRAGILSGSDAYGSFRGERSLTRGAAAALLARLADPQLRLRFSVKSFDLCRDVLEIPPETVLLTVEGRAVTAELFAPQLCLSLYQWQGNPLRALADAYTFYCTYTGVFHPLAQELDITLTEEELAQCAAYGQASHGLYGQSAAYRQYKREGTLLNQRMRDAYYEKDWKTGESQYQTLLAQRSKAMENALVPSQALLDLDLDAAYRRLMASPLYQS